MSSAAIGLILLAAGNSSRMGRAKQLLPYRGSTLLRHAAETALATGLGPLVVVLGAEVEGCRRALTGLDFTLVNNPGWTAGMGTSIRAGLHELERIAPECAGVLILLHDQPGIPACRLVELVQALTPGDVAVASVYDDALGVPAYFARALFEELRALPDPAGARKILEAHTETVHRFAMPEARHDIDTPQDYERLQDHILTRANETDGARPTRR